MGNLINKTIGEFKVQAFYQGKFMDVTREDTLGHWSVFFFYPADFTFVCPTELGDLADFYEEYKEAGCEIYSVSEDTHFVHKAWRMPRIPSKRYSIPCWETRPGSWPGSSACWMRKPARHFGEPLS